MKNPVAHHAVQLVAEALACVPWLVDQGDGEVSEHAALALLAHPNDVRWGI
ncbi:MAG: hypothetical protein ACK4NZ_11095 [Tsuneonella sp.]